MENTLHFKYTSPIGDLRATFLCDTLTALEFVDTSNLNVQYSHIKSFEAFNNCALQLDEYFRLERKEFQIDCKLSGTAFQNNVWSALSQIPYGKTCSYKEIATSINRDAASRAVGNANNKNPIAIIIPCHRVIGANGNLSGYGGGIWRKEFLLNLEKSI